ncbi:hypothetical protein PHMEG_0006592 [Phytophthora megakarya]|uniref:Uncharacterized protein n=1 Tax=Phytophthora megakarya TaxID=4795 RepID=A0A225WNG7_9STRA|nr:hypothetical protein PHMEG_0006592 [Phytophthora megakarya]
MLKWAPTTIDWISALRTLDATQPRQNGWVMLLLRTTSIRHTPLATQRSHHHSSNDIACSLHPSMDPSLLTASWIPQASEGSSTGVADAAYF